MNLRSFFFVLIAFFLLSSVSLLAQVETGTTISQGTTTTTTTATTPRVRKPKFTDGLSLDSGTIADQFQFITTRSNSYQNYKVIKKDWLNTIKAHVVDSLHTFKKELANERLQVSTQKDEINALNTKLTKANETINTLEKEKSSVSFLGMQMNKGAYKGLVWTIIAGLLGTLLFFIYRFRNSNLVTVETRKNLEELQEEFEAYKKRALEREQKVRRELQNVLNKRGEQ